MTGHFSSTENVLVLPLFSLYTFKYTKSQKNVIYHDKTQHEKIRGKPFFQATKQQLNGEKWD